MLLPSLFVRTPCGGIVSEAASGSFDFAPIIVVTSNTLDALSLRMTQRKIREKRIDIQ